VVELDRPQTTWWRMRNACWIPKATNRLSKHNTYCFSTATMVTRTRLDVTFYVQCLSSCILTKLIWWRHFTKLKHVARGTVRKCKQINSCVREGNSITCQFIEHWRLPVIRNYSCKTGLLSGPVKCVLSTFQGLIQSCLNSVTAKTVTQNRHVRHTNYFYTNYMMIYNTRTTFFLLHHVQLRSRSFYLCFIAGIYNSDGSCAAKRPTTTPALQYRSRGSRIYDGLRVVERTSTADR
jgi:hypothetical protein